MTYWTILVKSIVVHDKDYIPCSKSISTDQKPTSAVLHWQYNYNIPTWLRNSPQGWKIIVNQSIITWKSVLLRKQQKENLLLKYEEKNSPRYSRIFSKTRVFPTLISVKRPFWRELDRPLPQKNHCPGWFG